MGLFKSYSEREVKKVMPIVKKINDLDLVWQWDYTNDRFNTNYLGHIVHYVEGMIVQLRDKQMKQEQNR